MFMLIDYRLIIQRGYFGAVSGPEEAVFKLIIV